MNAIIVEDEALARDILREYLESHPDVHIQAECDKAQKAIKAIEEHCPDLIFLDIQLPDMNGFELLEKLRTLPYIIFTTAYDQYAIQAFEVNALDYLLKPFDQDRFDEALKRIKKQMEQRQFDQGKLENLLNTYHPEKKFLERILVKASGKIIIIRVADILWIEAEVDYIRLHTNQGCYLINQSMNRIEKKLDPESFVRVHRSAIVNMTSIREIHPWTSGRYKCDLVNGDEIILSRAGTKKLKQWML